MFLFHAGDVDILVTHKTNPGIYVYIYVHEYCCNMLPVITSVYHSCEAFSTLQSPGNPRVGVSDFFARTERRELIPVSLRRGRRICFVHEAVVDASNFSREGESLDYWCSKLEIDIVRSCGSCGNGNSCLKQDGHGTIVYSKDARSCFWRTSLYENSSLCVRTHSIR